MERYERKSSWNSRISKVYESRRHLFFCSVFLLLLFILLCFHIFFPKRNGANDSESKEKWYKFNDIFVEEFDMNEDTLEAECFGGTYKATVYDTGE